MPESLTCLSQASTTDCANNSSSSRWSPFLGGGTASLDPSALKLIHCIYCKDCRMENLSNSGTSSQGQAQSQPGTMSESMDSTGLVTSSSRAALVGMPLAAPRTPPDQASLQSSMDKNKETLKRKLMLRRSVNELVDRGIYPPLNTPPAFAEKTRQLERAKTGDLLRHKIQQRPDRQLLVQQHILEDTTIDPSLHERQRLLKRSRLLDDLNDKLAHRPGPLELVQGNILQPSHELANAIKDGTIRFLPTCDTEDMDQPSSSFMFDDESAGSDGAPSPSMDESSGLSDISSPSSAPPMPSGLSDVSSPSSAPPNPSAESLPIAFTFTKSMPVSGTANKSPPIPLTCSTASVIAASSSTTKILNSHAGTNSGATTSSNNVNNNGSSSGKFRTKKPKPKTTSKARIIKFHEYKGPPSVVKSQSSNSSTTSATSGSVEDTPYHIMLQQQQLFLQWQLEFQQRQQQQGSSPIATATSVGETSIPPAPAVSSIMVTSPVALAATSPTLIQTTVPAIADLASPASVQQSQVSSASLIAQPVFSPGSAPVQTSPQTAISQASPTPQAPPPAPPPPPSRPTQSVIPRQATKALTAIPASALSLPKLTGNLEEMKVADLKAELKKRSLPVSGPKPQLIERLKPFTESSSSNSLLTSAVAPKTLSRPPSRVSTPLQFSQTTFHIKTEPNGDMTASPITRPIPSTTSSSLLTSSSHNGASNPTSAFSIPITLPVSIQGVKTVVSVKPMVKEEPMIMTDLSPPVSPPAVMATTLGTITPMSPDYETISPTNLLSKLGPAVSQNMLKTANITNSCKLSLSGGCGSAAPGQTVVSMNTDTSRPASVVPAEMMPMEVDSVSVDLNQGVDDTAFKAASLGQSLDSAGYKALIQQPTNNGGFKTISVSQGAPENSAMKTVNISANTGDTNTIKTISLGPNFDGTATVKTVNVSPNMDPAAIRTVNLGSNTDSFKTLSLSPTAETSGFKTISISPVGDATSLLKTVKVPLSQLSPTHVSPVQFTAPLTHTLTSPASLLQLQQLQQLQTLQQLQQQLIQQTQAQQFQQPSQATTIQLTNNDQVVLAQAKQIEELQRQLQESHLKLKLQQLQQQQQQMQLQQQQQQLWQVRIPSNFAQNSLLTKLSQDQLTISPQIGQVMAASLQQQQQKQQSAPIFLNGHTLQQTPLVVSGVQQNQLQQQQPQQTSMMLSSPAVMSSSTSGTAAGISIGGTITTDSNIISMAGSSSGQTTVSLPYAIHINLTSSGQVKLPPQLQPITTSTTSSVAASTKSPSLPPLQLPAQLLLNSANILAAQPVHSEPATSQPVGLTNSTMLKSHVTSGQPFVFTAAGCPTALVPGHTNGVISRTKSVPSSPVVTDQQKVNVQRCASSSYFSGPMKEPPRYDEAIKIKQQQIVNPSGSNNKTPTTSNTLSKSLILGQSAASDVVKSQTMDDVLEILIRNGDLPPSAATEALTPKMIQAPATSTTCTTPPSRLSVTSSSPSPVLVSLAQSQLVLSPPVAPVLPLALMDGGTSQSVALTTSPRDQILTSVHTNMFPESFLSDTSNSSPQNPDTCSSSLGLNDGTSNSDGGELLDWNEMLPSPDLSNMDWTAESGFSHLDLGDSNISLDSKICDSMNPNHFKAKSRLVGGMLGPDPMCAHNGAGSHCHSDSSSNNSTGLRTPSMHGSEPDLTALGLGGDSCEAVDPASQMDMSDWLDVIMPTSSIGLESVSIPANTSFSADPILTPRTRQEVFDIFNFDDPDFGPSTMSWEKLTGQGTSS